MLACSWALGTHGGSIGPIWLKTCPTGRKGPESPITPQECTKQHKTHCLGGPHLYNNNNSCYFAILWAERKHFETLIWVGSIKAMM